MVRAVEQDLSPVLAQETQDDPDGRGLPRAVLSEKGRDPSSVHGETDVADGPDGAELPG